MPKKQVYDHWHTIQDSTIILGCGIKNGKLTVNFHKGGVPSGVYQYQTREKNLCCEMAESGSKGNFFHSVISPLPYTRIG